MKCSYCESEIVAGSAFCQNCGARVKTDSAQQAQAQPQYQQAQPQYQQAQPQYQQAQPQYQQAQPQYQQAQPQYQQAQPQYQQAQPIFADNAVPKQPKKKNNTAAIIVVAVLVVFLLAIRTVPNFIISEDTFVYEDEMLKETMVFEYDGNDRVHSISDKIIVYTEDWLEEEINNLVDTFDDMAKATEHMESFTYSLRIEEDSVVIEYTFSDIHKPSVLDAIDASGTELVTFESTDDADYISMEQSEDNLISQGYEKQ